MKIRGKIMPALLAAGLIAAPLAGAAPAFAADDGPTVSVTPDADLDPEAENSLTVAGSGFAPVNAEAGVHGVYVAIGPKGLFEVEGFHLNSNLYTSAVSVGDIPESGEFSTVITLESPTFDSDGSDVDCTETECGVYTWAAQDRKSTRLNSSHVATSY